MGHAIRGLLRTPGFTAAAVFSLALGIGANTAIFSVVDAALLKPMPISEPDRVVRLAGRQPQSFVWFNPRGFEVWPSITRTSSFDAVAAYVTGELTMVGRVGRLRAAAVTPEFSDVLGIHPVLGRAFNGQDINAGSYDLAVISHELWHTAFNGDRNILGRRIILNRQPFIVLGAMPRGFEVRALDPTLPLSEVKSMDGRVGDAMWRTRVAAWLFSAFAGLALLLTAVGIFGVMSQTVSQRTPEIGVRMALGAQRNDVLSLVLGRASVLTGIGIGAGIVIALGLTRVMGALLYETEPGDPATLAVVATVLGVVALAACYFPARRASRVNPIVALRYE